MRSAGHLTKMELTAAALLHTVHQCGPRHGELVPCTDIPDYTTPPAAACSVALPVYSTNSPPDVDTEISASSVAGDATAPSEPITLTTVRFFFSLPASSSAAAAGGV